VTTPSSVQEFKGREYSYYQQVERGHHRIEKRQIWTVDVPVRVGEYRSQLLAIRTGELSWDEANKWRLSLHEDFDRAFANTRLPERPDYQQANALLICARKMAMELKNKN
jgi:hypothetical protein